MLRALYTIVLCATLALLATMWLRPGIAQDLIALATGVRAQSPDSPAAGPQLGGYPTLPINNVPSAPMQPMPAMRPSTWPGTAAAISGQPMPGTAPNPNLYGGANSSPAGTGVTVWDPRRNFVAPAPYNAPSNSAFVGAAAAAPNSSNLPPGYTPPPGAMPPPGVPAMNAPLTPAPSAAAQLPSATVSQEVADAQVAAKVGSEIILVSDIKAFMWQRIEQNGAKTEINLDEFEQAYQQAARNILKHMVEMKLICNDAVHTIPAEGLKKAQADINKAFDKEEMPQMMKACKVATRQELEDHLRKTGRSLEWERRSFFEKNLYSGWVQQQLKSDETVPLGDVLGYYTEHHADYEFKAQARWEELMVSLDRFPDKAAAYATIAQMGIAVQQGRPFAEIAKTQSQGVTAYNGGAYDWTTQGSLMAKNIDEALFILPVNALSQIIETDRGFHIVRVLERKAGGRKSFEETQAEITKMLKEEKRDNQIKKYLDGLRQKTPVWTMFDDQPGGIDGPPKKEDQHFL